MEELNTSVLEPESSLKNREDSSNSDSLTLSMTPPLMEDTNTISEHLSSIENDRSMQEIEVSLPQDFALILTDETDRLSQESRPLELNTSSIISLNGLDKFIHHNKESRDNVNSILEEILANEQFKSQEESLNIFANVQFDEELLNDYQLGKNAEFRVTPLELDSFGSHDELCKRLQDLKELIDVKDTTIAALNSELDSFREMISNTSSNSLGTSTTEYKQFQEECDFKFIEYDRLITHKDNQIEKLTQSLQQSKLNCEEMKQHFKSEIAQLQEQLVKTSTLLKEHNCNAINTQTEEEPTDLLNQNIIEENKNTYQLEIARLEKEKSERDLEMGRLNDLLSDVIPDSNALLVLRQELETKYSREMEELRTYYEQKCAELEKHYSEEVFSQQSRKMSGSSSNSEPDLSIDLGNAPPGPGGDAPQFTITEQEIVISEDVDILKERDSLKTHNMSLKNFLGDLLQYFSQCEDELNNTLVEELLSKRYSVEEDESNTTRVRLTPNFAYFLDIINNSSEDVIDLKGELGSCLEQLQQDANAILASSSNVDKSDEAKNEYEDLKLQIEVADKKYKKTCQFLEEQAAEREMERDDAQREINQLREQLRDRDKDRASCERITCEVENLEVQLREMSKLMQTTEKRCKDVECEHKEAVDKIYELRDIIRDLEEQLKVRTNSEEELRNIVDELEVIVRQQRRPEQEEWTREGDVSTVKELHHYICNLEGEVQRLRLNTEIAGSEGAIQQIKNHLCDFETTLDKKTKDLEGLHITISTNCSSPSVSEEMSIRDVINPNASDSSIFEECEIPLQQLARLKEKLVRHSRAEDAAVKRIRDLEMQIISLKSDLEECQNEREILKKQTSDHLILISNLQIRLDEQRIRAEHIEKQTNTSLELQNFDLKNTIITLEETVMKRDKTINQLNSKIAETKKGLEDREKELSETKEDELIARMQEQLEFLRSENYKLKLENEKRMEMLSSIEYSDLDRLRKSGLSIRDLIESNEGPDQMRRAHENLEISHSPFKRNKNETIFLGAGPEISSIEKVGPNLFHSLQTPNCKTNSTEKHVRFEDDEILKKDFENKLKMLENQKETETLQLKTELEEKNAQIAKIGDELKNIEALKETENKALKAEVQNQNKTIEKYRQKLESLQLLENKIENLQKALDNTETTLNKATETFQQEQKLQEEKSQILKLELNEKSEELEKHRKMLYNTNKALQSKEESLNALNSELNNLKLSSNQQKASLQEKIEEKEQIAKEIPHLEQLLVEKDKIIAQMSEDSKSLHSNLESIQAKMQESGNVLDLQKKLRDEQKKNAELTEELHGLRVQLLTTDRKSLEDITGQVQRELDYSAYLDKTLINAVSDSSLDSQDVGELRLTLRKQKSVIKQISKAKEMVELNYEEVHRKNVELQRNLEISRLELAKRKTQLTSTQTEDAKLIEELSVRLEETLNNERKLLIEVESLKAHKLNSKEHNSLKMRELEQEKYILEDKIEELKNNDKALKEALKRTKLEAEEKVKEMENAKVMVTQIDNDRKELKKQIDELNQKIKSNNIESSPVPEKLMDKIRELRNAVKDNLQMMDLITRLTNEKSVLEQRIETLENRNIRDLPFDDPIARANYLFAKYLRSESYRKALVWQKRYLVSLLGTYQSAIVPTEKEAPKKSSGINRFKRVALVVVSMNRMKYLVKRWHSGKRITQERAKGAQFQVGQPVSSKLFSAPSRMETNSTLPWFGSSPPSKDTLARVRESQPLNSPALLSKYVERFNQIQERLGLDASH